MQSNHLFGLGWTLVSLDAAAATLFRRCLHFHVWSYGFLELRLLLGVWWGVVSSARDAWEDGVPGAVCEVEVWIYGWLWAYISKE